MRQLPVEKIPGPLVSDVEVRRMAFADGALGAAGHEVTDPELRKLLHQAASGTMTVEETIARGVEHIDAS